ncbi:MAG: ATP-NAD kinase [Haloarculaceae archaeon]
MSQASDADPTLGVVGDDGSVAGACREAGVDTVAGTPETVVETGLDAILTTGEGAFRAVAVRAPEVPLLPIDAGAGVRAVPAAAAGAAIEEVVAGEATLDTYPVLSIIVDGEPRSRAVYDVTAVTVEPAQISEYRVTYAGEQVARFRADGVVAAPPAGTPDYARAAGGPVVPTGPSVVVVVPIAPFATTTDEWVLPVDDVAIEVLRGEAAVELVVDGGRVGDLGVDTPVELAVAHTIECYRAAASRSPFATGGGESEKH